MNVFDYFFDSIKDWEKPFIVDQRNSVSFITLYQKSCRLASYLQKEIGSGKNIILISPNSEFFITVYLAILKSGNICIPLNHATETENLNYIIDLTESSTIFSFQGFKMAEQVTTSVRVLDEIEVDAIISFESPLQVDPDFDQGRTAEIIFTSGSTGKPKGVVISHSNIMANTDSIIAYLNIRESDRMCVVLPFFYCYGLSLLHTHLKAGGSIVLNNNFIFIGSVLNDIKNYKCTGFAGVPSHFQILLKKSDSFRSMEFPHLRYVTQAGGKLHDVFVKDFVSSFPDIKFFIMYGQTEATARLSYLPAEDISKKPGSIGIPIPDVELKVVDPKGNKMPPGKEGELIARGKNIMKGYFKDEVGTSETLVDGWLYTGDIAKMDTEGYFYIIARKKEIIKVGGKRVSPKEIEEVILALPEVIDCTISAQEDPLLGESIKAEIVLEKGNNEMDIREKISRHCSKFLALYKIPQSFEFLKTVELTSTGKKPKRNNTLE